MVCEVLPNALTSSSSIPHPPKHTLFLPPTCCFWNIPGKLYFKALALALSSARTFPRWVILSSFQYFTFWLRSFLITVCKIRTFSTLPLPCFIFLCSTYHHPFRLPSFLCRKEGERKERKQLLIELLCAGIWFWHIFAHFLCTNSLWFQDCHLYFIDMEIRDETGLRLQNMDLLETGLGFILTDSKGPVFPTLSSCLPEYVFNHVPHSFIFLVSDSVNSAHYRLFFKPVTPWSYLTKQSGECRMQNLYFWHPFPEKLVHSRH